MHRPTRRRFLRTALGAGGSLGLGAAWLARRPTDLQSVTASGWALGSEVSITVLDRSRRVARRAADAALAELALVEEVTSLYRDDSQLVRLNRHGVLADPHPYLVDVLDNLCAGRGKPEDVELLVNISNNMMGNTICAFADGTAMPMLGMVQKFREEFMEAASNGVPEGVRHDDSVRAMVEGGA